MAGTAKRKIRPLLLVASIPLIIIVVSLHAVGGIVLLKTGLGDFSVHNPIAYALIGLPVVFAIFKLKHVVGVVHRKNKVDGAGNVRKG